MKGYEPPLGYTLANYFVLSKIKTAIGLDQCHAFYYGAAPLKQTSVDYFASLDIQLFNVFGMSETAGGHAQHTFTKFRLDTTGFCLPGADMKID